MEKRLEETSKANVVKPKVDIKGMTVADVANWIEETFVTEIAQQFEEQNIDGKVLLSLAKRGTGEQFEACGLITVGDQLRLGEMVDARVSSLSVPINSPCTVTLKRKPTKAQLKQLSEMNQKLYKVKRKAVRAAAIKQWPGNEIPTFKNNNSALADLNALTESLAKECSFEPAGFREDGIKQHILDVLNERRRHQRKGHDYQQADKRTLKRKLNTPGNSGSSDLDESFGSSASTSTGTNSQSDAESATTVPVDSSGDEDVQLSTQENPKRFKCVDRPQKYGGRGQVAESINDEEEDKCHDEPLKVPDDPNIDDDDIYRQQSNKEGSIDNINQKASFKGTAASGLIICVAYNAIRLADVSRGQLQSSAKALGLKTSKKDKTSLVSLIANALLEKGYMKISGDPKSISRSDIVKVKPF